MTEGRRVRVLLGLLLLFAAALTLNLSAAERPRAGRESEARGSSAHAVASGRPLPSRAEFVRMLAAIPPEVPTQPAGHADHPHPITPDHERLYRDVDLLREADEAIKAGDYERAREVLGQHHRELAGMSTVEEEGLLLLADCAQYGRPEHVARVRCFYEEHTDSMVRRRLRRACLEPAEPH